MLILFRLIFLLFMIKTQKINFRSKKFWKRLVLLFFGVPTFLFFVLVAIVYFKQDVIVQDLINDMNKDFKGRFELDGSHISMFENFPYISIDLEHFRVYEDKSKGSQKIIDVKDTYIGFNLWTILTGNMEIKKIKMSSGKIDLVQHVDGSLNIINALAAKTKIESVEDEFHLDLKKVELVEVDLTKLNEANGLKIETYISKATAKFKTNNDHLKAGLESKFVLNIIKDGDTTFLKHKHINFNTEIDFNKSTEKLLIKPTIVHLENAEFEMKGSIDFQKDVFLDLILEGNNPNFDLFIAMSPESLMNKMKDFNNSGDIEILAKIKGSSIDGKNPEVDILFSCRNGQFVNKRTSRKVDRLNFKGHFTNGTKRNLSTMQFDLRDFYVGVGEGELKADLVLENFKAPEIRSSFHSKLDLSFVSQFLDLEHLSDLKGDAVIDVEFADIIDFEKPEHTFTDDVGNYKLGVDLNSVSFKTDLSRLPIENFNFSALLEDHKASINRCDVKIGRSDLHISGEVDDIPAIVHHTNIPVDTRLHIWSDFLDIYQLTGGDENAFDEQIEKLKLDLDFKASARAFTESKYLPQGEFLIENLHAKLKHYPHEFHDFHADIFIEEQDLRVVDFTGEIDKSDFHFTGKLEHYEKWLDEHPGGDSKIEFNMNSNILQLESVFTYKGEQFVPEEYRHEELDNLQLHGFTYLHYNDELKSIDLTIDKFNAKMKVHPLRFKNFSGRIHYEDDHIVIEKLSGQMGHSNFSATLNYYLGENEVLRKRDNYFSLTASRLDMDQLLKYNPMPATAKSKSDINLDHDSGFNIYDLPFTDMKFHFDIDHFNYHRYLIKELKAEMHITPDHYIHIDQMKLRAAGGKFDIKGYFNGSNPDLIYFSPEIEVENVDLDQLMFKFENFGQDYVVSENLHGKFTGHISGKIHMHNDLVPKIDDSEIHLDLDVIHGSLENYAMLHYMSDYFKDKHLDKVLFDTLSNHIDIVEGKMTIPAMTINSSLGHMEISGEQDLNGRMEYYFKIPWKMVTQTAMSKLFGGNKPGEEKAEPDEIIYGTDKTKYVTIKITGNDDGYSFSIGKPKKKK